MPCNSDYMNPLDMEVELSKVACLLDELKDGKKIDPNHWAGYHPMVYSKIVDGDSLVSELCTRLQEEDVSKFSLEMQIWWRDHKAADIARVNRELNDNQKDIDKAKALAKLSQYEKDLLGL